MLGTQIAFRIKTVVEDKGRKAFEGEKIYFSSGRGNNKK